MIHFFKKSHDGGRNSGVTGYWLIECKKLFSIVILKFEPNNRKNFHNHAFNAITWWVRGKVCEVVHLGGYKRQDILRLPSLIPKLTPRTCTHKITVIETAWAISIRGPWKKTWQEITPEGKVIHLSNGRRIVKGTEDG